MKQCIRCKKFKSEEEFHKNKAKKDGKSIYCKECLREYGKKYRDINKEVLALVRKEYIFNHKKEKSEYDKKYYKKNKELKKLYSKNYREENKDLVSETLRNWRINNADRKKEMDKEYQKKNIDRVRVQRKKYYGENVDHIKEYHKKYREENTDSIKAHRHGPAKYIDYVEKISYAEEVKNNNSLLEVKCTYCNRWFTPTNSQVLNRICALIGSGCGEQRLYCSEECKQACPTFRRQKYERGQELTTSREVPAEFRKMALEDRNHTCEKCGSAEDGLHVHHIEGYSEAPMLSADLCNVLVVCKKCHKEIHKQPGCSYSDYGLCKIK